MTVECRAWCRTAGQGLAGWARGVPLLRVAALAWLQAWQAVWQAVRRLAARLDAAAARRIAWWRGGF